ncbi:hypothetical protein [Peribacillus butanolivorans]|uniref:hypothetical protein n=1 Tax=Peribacillus butanolivorans TaxID=421767 RepID=UPI0036DA3EA6
MKETVPQLLDTIKQSEELFFKTKYSLALKAVPAYLEGVGSFRTIANQPGLIALKHWVAHYKEHDIGEL